MKQTRQISRDSLEESTQRALIEHQDIGIPNELQLVLASTSSEFKLIQATGRGIRTAIDRDLLQDIRDLMDSGAEEYSEMKDMRNKLDSLYPYLSLKEYQRTNLSVNPQEWPEGFGKSTK